MATFNSPDCTGVPAPAVHVGINSRFVTYLLNETASGSTNVNMAALPPGARITDVQLYLGNNAVGIVAAPGDVRVQDSLGNVYIASASANKQYHTMNPTFSAFGKRLTASCNLQVVFNAVATGTGSTNISVLLQYTKTEDGD